MVSIKIGVVAVSAYFMLLLVIQSPYKTSGKGKSINNDRFMNIHEFQVI